MRVILRLRSEHNGTSLRIQYGRAHETKTIRGFDDEKSSIQENREVIGLRQIGERL